MAFFTCGWSTLKPSTGEFQDARGDIGAFGVQHGIVVRRTAPFKCSWSILVGMPPNRRPCIETHHPFHAPLKAFIPAFWHRSVGTFRNASSTIAVSSTSGFTCFRTRRPSRSVPHPQDLVASVAAKGEFPIHHQATDFFIAG